MRAFDQIPNCFPLVNVNIKEMNSIFGMFMES